MCQIHGGEERRDLMKHHPCLHVLNLYHDGDSCQYDLKEFVICTYVDHFKLLCDSATHCKTGLYVIRLNKLDLALSCTARLRFVYIYSWPSKPSFRIYTSRWHLLVQDRTLPFDNTLQA